MFKKNKVRRIVISKGGDNVVERRYDRLRDLYYIRREMRSEIRKLEGDETANFACYQWQAFNDDDELITGEKHLYTAPKWATITQEKSHDNL